MSSGVVFDDVKHIVNATEVLDGLFYKRGDVVTFEPFMVGTHTTDYTHALCKICKMHVGYYIPSLNGTFIFHENLI
jgi:hypothetical protein